MRLKNNLLRELNNEIIIALALGIFTSFLISVIYTSNTQDQTYTLVHFFKWAAESINSLLAYSDLKSKILIILFSIFLPLGIYLCCIAYIIKYVLAVINLNSGMYIKSVKLLPDKICFNYNKPSHNTTCKFSEIKNIDMNVYVSKMNVYSNGLAQGSGYQIDNINFKFIKTDNSELSICMTPFPLYVTSFIFSIIDYCKRNNLKISYKFAHIDGHTSTTTEDLQTQIDNYKKYGKPRLTDTEKCILGIASVLLYILGIGLIINFKNNVANFPEDFGLIIFLIPIFFSTVMDISYIYDKKQFKDINTNNKLYKHYEIYSFLKILLAIIVIAACFI